MEDTYDVGDHGKGIPLGHALLDMQEVTGPAQVVHHQSVTSAIAVEGKLLATSPLESDGPHNCRPIIIIEHILRTNEEGTPGLLLSMM